MKRLTLAPLLLVLAACATTPAIPSVPEQPVAHGHRLEVGDGMTIFYRVIGGHGPFVLVPLGRIIGDLQPIADAGYRLVLMDPRGRGASSPVTAGTALSLETDLADLDAVRQAVGADEVSLIGMSYYGALVALYAAEYPERVDRIVMLGPMAPTAELFADRTAADNSQHPDYLELDRMRREGVHESDPVAFCRQYFKAHSLELYHDPSRFDESALDYCELANEQPDQFLQWASQLFESIGSWDFTQRASKVRAPALIIQGRQDQITPPKGAPVWAEAMKNQARLVWIDDCGHVPLKEHPEETRALILEFLE